MIMWRAGILVASVAATATATATASADAFDNRGNGTCVLHGNLQDHTLGYLRQNYNGVGSDSCHNWCSSDNRCAAYTLDVKHTSCKKHGNYDTFKGVDADGFEFGEPMSQQGMTTDYIAARVNGNADDSLGQCRAKKPRADPPKASAHRHVVAGAASVLLVAVSLLLAE